MFDPLYVWLGIPPEEQPPHYYRLLGVAIFESDDDVIREAAETQLAYMQAFAGGPNLGEAKAISDLIAQARSVLLDRREKSEYDRRLREHLAAPRTSSPLPAAKPPVVPVSDLARHVAHERIAHRTTLAQYAALSLILVAIVYAVVYAGIQLQDMVARRLSPMPRTSPVDVPEPTDVESDAPASQPSEGPRTSLAPLITAAHPLAVDPWEIFEIPSEDEFQAQQAALESSSDSDDVSQQREASESKSSTPRWLAPDVNFATLSGEDPIRLSDYRSSQVVMLDFWATWCGPCIQAMPGLAKLASEYRSDEVRLIAVNTEEEPEVIRRFLADRQLDIEVALDQRGEAASAFGVEQLPTLVLIDKQGIVQRMHVGFDPNLAAILTEEIDSLVAGESLIPDPTVASHLYDDRIDSPSTKVDARMLEELSRQQHQDPEFPLTLHSGRTIDVGTIFGEIGEAFEQSLKDKLSQRNAKLLRVTYDESSQTKLLISRRGKELHGPLVSYRDDGSPLAYACYRYGARSSTLFTWDEMKRPFVFEQYQAGKKHGLRCLFKACSDACRTGHIWLLQEWDEGELGRAHVVLQDGTPVSLDDSYRPSDRLNDETSREFALATSELKKFEQRLDADENKLKQAVADYHEQLRRMVSAQVNARIIANRNRPRSIMIALGTANMSMGASAGPSIGMPGIGSSMGNTTIRNCGSS